MPRRGAIRILGPESTRQWRQRKLWSPPLSRQQRGRRSEVLGVKVTRLGRREYKDELIRRKDPFGREYFWIGGGPPGGAGEPGTDLHAVAAGYVSVTPVQLDLTNHNLIEQIARWGLTA